MKPLWDSGRDTGRTKRMLRAAVAAAQQDRAVFVVATSQQIPGMLQHTLTLAPRLRRINDRSVWCPEGGGYVRFMEVHEGMLHRLMKHGCATFADGHTRTVIMIDHHVVEQEFGFGLDQWLRWSRKD